MMNYLATTNQRHDLDKAVEGMMRRHPCAAFFGVLVGLPLLLIGGLLVCSTAIMLPVSCLMGWV